MSTKIKNDDAAGRITCADKADVGVPAASSPKAAKGRFGIAAEARLTVPDAAPHDGKGRKRPADKAVSSVPDPSPNAEEGRERSADKAVASVPTSATKSRAGRTRIADKARCIVPVSASIDALADLGVTRKFWIKSVNRQKNALGALIRLSLGWKPDLPESEGKKIRERAARVITAGMAGKEQKPEDIEIFKKHENEIAIMGQTILMMDKTRHNAELAMQRIVRKLPVYPLAKEVKGLGELGLAVILAEAGDLSNYPKKGHLWKRLGLAPFEGKAYSTWRMKGGLSAEQWTDAGYSPRRRAEIYAVISEPLFRAQSVAAGPYRAVYDRRRALTAGTHEDWTKAHSHMDALRVMTKILLRDLWAAWRRDKAALPNVAGAEVPDAETNRRKAGSRLPEMAGGGVPTGEPDERKAETCLPEEAGDAVPTAQLIAAE